MKSSSKRKRQPNYEARDLRMGIYNGKPINDLLYDIEINPQKYIKRKRR